MGGRTHHAAQWWAELTTAQAGVVSRRQALAVGISEHQITRKVRSGHWQQLHRAVFATFSGPPSFEAQVWAALLRAGRGAVLSHETAAYLHGLADEASEIVHVTVAADRQVTGRIDRVRIHYSHRLARTGHPALVPPRTRVEETVLDLVDVAATPARAASWVLRACQRRRTTPERLADSLGRRKKIRWRPMLEAMLADVAEGAESPLELRHLRAVERGHRLPSGSRQRRVAGARVIWIDVDYDE